ncbi:unnamed protein product [Clonostachys rhizophaga]|uniref:ER-bound oxygenase mpaB/mpaB'/Rubber oxygenase catalytic domain-containing protein n=1 Tax=Clonostachys rhizophaga TaxID=160324 RepID=A0A9N9VA48_9HYPO|nr:unnamed protein product [Clonostachys rhizophaga]
MACPAGFGNETPTKPGAAFTKPHIFETIQEPRELRSLTQDCIFLLGGHFAILCQFAHPGLAEGSFKHSNFAYRIMNRLKTTARFLNAAVMGTQEEKEAIFSVIHAAHADVKGPNYYADDPELHKWTAATLFVSLIIVHEAFFGKLSKARQEVMYKESAVYATSLRMPPEMWPETLDDFWVYWNHNIDTLEVTDWAKSLTKDLMFQAAYDLKPTPINTLMYHFVVGNTALIWPFLPKVIKQGPSRYYLSDMRKSVKRIEETGSWHEIKS